jgi:hypothetical protein
MMYKCKIDSRFVIKHNYKKQIYERHTTIVSILNFFSLKYKKTILHLSLTKQNIAPQKLANMHPYISLFECLTTSQK